MAEAPTNATYVAALGYPTGMGFSDFDSITFEAVSDGEAKEKAHEWAMKHTHGIDAQTWLQVARDGHGIYSQPIGRP